MRTFLSLFAPLLVAATLFGTAGAAHATPLPDRNPVEDFADAIELGTRPEHTDCFPTPTDPTDPTDRYEIPDEDGTDEARPLRGLADIDDVAPVPA